MSMFDAGASLCWFLNGFGIVMDPRYILVHLQNKPGGASGTASNVGFTSGLIFSGVNEHVTWRLCDLIPMNMMSE